MFNVVSSCVMIRSGFLQFVALSVPFSLNIRLLYNRGFNRFSQPFPQTHANRRQKHCFPQESALTEPAKCDILPKRRTHKTIPKN